MIPCPITPTLAAMSALLQQNGHEAWARRLEDAAALLQHNPQAARAELRALYGGMGSINDIVLYQNMQPLLDQNQAFDRLRQALYLMLE